MMIWIEWLSFKLILIQTEKFSKADCHLKKSVLCKKLGTQE